MKTINKRGEEMSKLAIFALVFMLTASTLLCSFYSPSGYFVEHDHTYYSDFQIVNNDAIEFDYHQRTLQHNCTTDAFISIDSEINQIPLVINLPGFTIGEYLFTITLDKQPVVVDFLKTWNDPIEFILTNLTLGIHELVIEVADLSSVNIIRDYITISAYNRNTVWQNNHGDIVVLVQQGVPGSYQEIRPVLFLEGFPIYEDTDHMQNLVNMWRSSLPSNSSVFQLTLSEPQRSLIDNAMVALAAIRFVHNQLPTQLKEGTSVFGYSMGGIIARYALAYAESQNIDHYCSKYISLDAPHKGAALNENIQRMFNRLENWLDDNRFYIQIYNSIHSHHYDPDVLDPYITKLSSVAARQLFRANIWASGTHDYNTGSSTFRSLFSELDSDYGPLENVINYDPTFPPDKMKPGFPYKQNNVKCLAYSHGSLQKSGNTNQEQIATHYSIDFVIGWPWFWTSSDSFDADCLAYDTQPGSTIPDLTDSADMPEQNDTFQFEQHYAPVIVPTRSSLGLRVAHNTMPNSDIDNFSMSCFEDISESDVTILNHTYFDKIEYASVPTDSEWNWEHGDLISSWVQPNVTNTVEWMNNLDQRTIGYITGILTDPEPTTIAFKMYVNGILNHSGFVDATGSYSAPYTYASNAEVRLTFDKPGYLQTCKVMYVSYQSGQISYPPITSVVFRPYNLGNIIVSKGGQYSFDNISAIVPYLMDCVYSEQYTGEPILIRVLPGTYNETIDFSPLANGQISNLTLIGWGPGVIVDAQYLGSCIRVTGQGIGNLLIDNVTLTNAMGGIHVNLQDCNRLTVTNCTITNCLSSNFRGLAVVSNVPATISNCTISGNGWFDDGQGESSAAGLFLVNNTTSPTSVTDCSINNNYAETSSALYIYGSGHFEVSNNTFSCNNPNGDFQNPDPNSFVISIDHVGSADIIHNVILEEYQPNCISINNSGIATKNINVINNTFNNLGTCISVTNNSRVIATNNIFDYCYTGIHSSGQSNNIHIKNNLFNTVTPLEGITYNPATHPNCLFNEDSILDSGFYPVWDSTLMSPCIDAGTGSNDPDGTPADIGAFRATDHRYWQYRFRSGENDRSDPYHWVSYPVVNSLTQGKTVARSFFHELLGTHEIAPQVFVADVLQEIVWYESNQSRYIVWDGSGWGPFIDTHNVVSPQGYKVKLLSVDNSGLPPTTVELHHSGFLTPENTPFMIYGSASNGVQTYENWIGYFDTESVWPTDAFASIWNDIKMIKAKDWCLYRDPNSGVGALIGKMLPINCGDMVIVTTVNDHEFQWNTTVPTDPKKKEVPTAFEYVEKADYTPVYIDLSAVDLSNLKEIGLKLDGICKGAVVVTDSLEQICAYLEDGESLSSGLVELVFFYESKSQPLEMRSVAIYDKQLSSNMIGGDSAYPVYNIKVSTADLSNTVVPVLSLEQNYPNPFNPTTSIRYSIEETGPVSLDIYNIKGQLVKTLYHGNAEIGSHTAIWNGLDNSGNACSSGVYFYRLRTPKTSLARKMLLLK